MLGATTAGQALAAWDTAMGHSGDHLGSLPGLPLAPAMWFRYSGWLANSSSFLALTKFPLGKKEVGRFNSFVAHQVLKKIEVLLVLLLKSKLFEEFQGALFRYNSGSTYYGFRQGYYGIPPWRRREIFSRNIFPLQQWKSRHETRVVPVTLLWALISHREKEGAEANNHFSKKCV